MIYNKAKKKSKRIVGRINRDNVIYGSESHRIKKITSEILAPFDLYDKKEKEYKKNELNIFKKYTSSLYKSVWDE